LKKLLVKLSPEIFLICLLWVSLLSLTGCWDRREINDLAVILATGIDKKEDETIELSVQILIPVSMTQGDAKGGGGEGKETVVLSFHGISIADAMSKLQKKVPRQIFWGHNEIIIFGEEFAKEGIREQLDFFARHPTTRLRSYIFVCKGKAGDILEVAPILEITSGETLRELAVLEIGMKVTLKNILLNLVGDTKATAVPWIDIVPSRSEEEENKNLHINGTAIFRNDKMIGYIDDKTTRGLLWLKNEIRQATVTIFPKEEKEEFITFNIIRANTELHPEINDDKWIMNIKIVAEDDVLQNGTNLDVKSTEIVRKLEKQLEEDLQSRIKLVLQPVQKEMKADVFGFAEAFHRKFPKEWGKVKDNWEDVFSEMEVNIDPKVYVRRTGMTTAPQGLPKEEVQKK
jgi:spore germination protein KC